MHKYPLNIINVRTERGNSGQEVRPRFEAADIQMRHSVHRAYPQISEGINTHARGYLHLIVFSGFLSKLSTLEI